MFSTGQILILASFTKFQGFGTWLVAGFWHTIRLAFTLFIFLLNEDHLIFVPVFVAQSKRTAAISISHAKLHNLADDAFKLNTDSS